MAIRQSAGGQFFIPTTERIFDEKSDMKLSETENTLTGVAPLLRKVFQMHAQTSEEKFKVLDTRDKLYKMMRDKDPALKRGALIATCTDMCPEKERLLRDYQGRGSMFEMTNFYKNSNFNHSLAVKEYARSSADQEEPLPHDLRPVHILTMTMSHLLHNVVDYCELSDENLEEWYMFMWDRTRALRKELTQQGVCNLESVTLVEQCARFHIHCAERLIDQDSSIYDDKINTENLTKCLQTLKYMYKDLAKEDIKCHNEPEFICYSLLLNLNNSSVFTELSGMSTSLMNSEPVKFALDVMTTWETKNYIRFFNLVKKTTYLNCCLLRRYFGEMRLYAIKTMIRSYCTKNYSPQILISRFVEALNFEREDECLNFLSYCHFNFHKIDGKTAVNFDRVLFQNPTSAISTGRAFWFIEEKKRRPLSVIMAGGTLPPKLFENYIPSSSFTPDGNLNPDALPHKELLDFFSTSASLKIDLNLPNKAEAPLLDIFSQKEQTESAQDLKLKKEETLWFPPPPTFSLKDNNPPSTNIFGAAQSYSSSVSTKSNILGSNFANTNIGTFENLFNSPVKPNSANIFGNTNLSPLFCNTKSTTFSSEAKLFPTADFSSSDSQQQQAHLETNNVIPVTNSFNNQSSCLVTILQNKSESVPLKIKLEEEKERIERLENERKIKEEENLKKKQEEEEKTKLFLERQRLQEENKKQEMEKREREKREQEERRKQEELTRLEREERYRLEEEARQEKLKEFNAKRLKELKRQEENKRRIEFEHKQKVNAKILDLKKKIQKWKAKVIFDKWRMKTWTSIEERKMKDYFKEVKVKYPPVCTEEQLDGNPYGLIIPSALTFEKFRDWKEEFIQEPSKKLLIINNDLPLLKLNSILGRPLEEFSKSLGSKLDPFPWKLIISVPDNFESPDSWKSIETFVEMHFVEHFQWQFGIQKGPLYCQGGSRGPFRFKISIRKLRGSKLFEGDEPNMSATTGSNALMFFISECGNEITRERLEAILKSRSPLPKIPVVIIILNAKQKLDHLKNLLDFENLEKSYVSRHFITPVFDGKHHLVVQLTKCLCLAAINSASPPPFRIQKFSSFFSGSWIDSLWRRVEISLSNFKIVLHEPEVLIDFYNSCIEELIDIFLDKKYFQYTVLAEEFSECEVNLPVRTPIYENRLKSLLDRLKLPHWPSETPKSCHQLNYRIHQYSKKITGRNRTKIKSLKWVLYKIIRHSLSWKGLDIYCDDDINEVLTNFPWLQVFQEISRVITRQLCEEVKDDKEMIIAYDIERVENFSFESSFIGKVLSKIKRKLTNSRSVGEENEELDELHPCLEKDSVIYAFSAAIERENNKRKREECVEESLDALFLSPASKRIILGEEEQSKDFNFSEINANFQSLDARLNEMKKRITENFKILNDIQSKMQ